MPFKRKPSDTEPAVIVNRSIERFRTTEGLILAGANERMNLESRNSFVAMPDPVSVTSAGTIRLFYT